MSWVFDVIVLLIVALTVFLGYRRGFLRTIVQLVGCLLALILAFSFSQTVSTWVYDTMLRDTVYEKIETAWQDTTASGAATLSDKVESMTEALPGFVKSVWDPESVTKELQQFLNSGETAQSASVFLTDTVLRPILVTVIRFIAFLILYALLMVAVKLLVKLIKPLSRLPLIRQADGVLGAVSGFLKGILFAFVAVTILQLLAVGDSSLVVKEDLANSYIAGWLAELNPLSDVLNLD